MSLPPNTHKARQQSTSFGEGFQSFRMLQGKKQQSISASKLNNLKQKERTMRYLVVLCGLALIGSATIAIAQTDNPPPEGLYEDRNTGRVYTESEIQGNKYDRRYENIRPSVSQDGNYMSIDPEHYIDTRTGKVYEK